MSLVDSKTAILEFNRTEQEAVDPQWFAVTRWATEDVRAVAAEHGMTMTEEQATNWWKRNEKRFRDLLTEAGNEILSNMDFEEDD